jgi:signal transduction histidine kinase
MSHMTNLLAMDPGGTAQAEDAGPLFERHPVASLLVTREGRVVQVNAAARQLLRAEDQGLAGTLLSELLPEIAVSLVGLAAPVCHRRTIVRRADGANFFARVHGAVAGAGPLALLLVGIEDRSEIENEISAANTEFEALTSAAGHDLRGPLRILKGFTEALEDECGAALNDEGRTFLKEIIKASDRMEGLIDGLLAYSRSGRAEMARESLDLSTLIELVYYELRHAQGDRQVECRVDPGLNAWGDVRLMMTVLRNVLGNAWKFTSKNTRATIHCHAQERDGRNWICMTDDGAGFDMAQASRLFKPFTRLHRQDEFPGHGMGLATAHRIVKRHGGEIEAASTPGQGTTIRFWLPRAPDM